MKALVLGYLLLGGAVIAQPPPMQSGDGIWLRNAYYGEAQTFDSCVGHQPGSGMYHHHANPVCLRAQLDDNLEQVRTLRTGGVYREKAEGLAHSPILGWSFDGYPIYGPYGYGDAATAESEVRRMRPSFRLREITRRDSLPDWAMVMHPNTPQQLAENQFGPPINARFPLGRYLEDYEFVEGLGDLDAHNGRFTVTPEFPEGTYAYFVAIAEDGTPAFPYILGATYYGTVGGGQERAQPANAQDFAPGTESESRLLTSWATRNAGQAATVKSAFNPSAETQTTWPFEVPAGVNIATGVRTPANADIQRVRFNDASVWVNANGLASYTMGPWFDALQPGGIFGGWPNNLNTIYRVPRTGGTQSGAARTGLGAVGVWVNGVAVFNALDGASYSNARGTDVGGGLVNPTAIQVSAASPERGPVAPGTLVHATPLFGAVLATEEAAISAVPWPAELAGTTVTIVDSAGTTHAARIGAVSPERVTYLIPEMAATGYARVTINAGSTPANFNIYVVDSYPSVYEQTEVEQSGDRLFVILTGTGLGKQDSLQATLGGVEAPVIVEKSPSPGQETYRIEVPAEVMGKGEVPVVIRNAGRSTNPVTVPIP